METIKFTILMKMIMMKTGNNMKLLLRKNLKISI